LTLRRPPTLLLIVLILLVGLAFRLVNIGFGLPAMYDPDEPLFVLKAFKLIDGHTLNPGWFGHPGTTTIYLLALIDIIVALVGLGSGAFATLPQFAAAVYANPGLIFIPSRVAMALIGVGTIWLAFLIARRLFDDRVAVVAAAFVALNAVHIAWSQIIRTDIPCSLFMLAALLFAIRSGQEGRLRDTIYAAMFAGVATATKWPGSTVMIAVAGAAFHLWRADRDVPALLRRLALATVAMVGGLFASSPYIFLDWRTVIGNVNGEVASGHLAHSGHGFMADLWWFLDAQVAGSMGWIGLTLTLSGLVLIARRPLARATLLPAAILFLILISAQQQIWSRWITPILPMLAIAAALATVTIGRWLAARSAPRWRTMVVPLIAAIVLLPSLAGAVTGAQERANDVRGQASTWAIAHIPAGSTVVVEQLALDLRPQPWRFLFPIGEAGCVDGRQILKGGVKFESVQKARRGSAIVDVGNVAADKLETCRADYAILTYYDLYLTEQKDFPDQVKRYNELIRSGRTVAIFSAPARFAGWPSVRIIELDRRSAAKRVAVAESLP
jgi:Dolichyl-phosphate-mannose-protein mannosyltransferase